MSWGSSVNNPVHACILKMCNPFHKLPCKSQRHLSLGQASLPLVSSSRLTRSRRVTTPSPLVFQPGDKEAVTQLTGAVVRRFGVIFPNPPLPTTSPINTGSARGSCWPLTSDRKDGQIQEGLASRSCHLASRASPSG